MSLTTLPIGQQSSDLNIIALILSNFLLFPHPQTQKKAGRRLAISDLRFTAPDASARPRWKSHQPTRPLHHLTQAPVMIPSCRLEPLQRLQNARPGAAPFENWPSRTHHDPAQQKLPLKPINLFPLILHLIPCGRWFEHRLALLIYPSQGIPHQRRIAKHLEIHCHSQSPHIFATMSGMLDLPIDEKAKHFLPRWFSDAPT